MINENIGFLIQLVQEKQARVDEVLRYDEPSFTNKKVVESAKAHQQSCADALNFLKELEVEK